MSSKKKGGEHMATFHAPLKIVKLMLRAEALEE